MIKIVIQSEGLETVIAVKTDKAGKYVHVHEALAARIESIARDEYGDVSVSTQVQGGMSPGQDMV